jgi:5-oxoprolinase (ATP-hydrolysing)
MTRAAHFYVGSRGHHADIGGTTPGSMPPFSTRIEEEGVQINNVKLVERGVLREAEMLALLQSGEYPSRNPQQNMADLKAQIAANEKGVQELRKMVDQFSLDVVQAYMRHVQDNAEESVRRVITRLKDGAFTLPLDNGAQIQVAVRVDAASRSATIDFTGTSAAADQQLQRAHGGVHGGGAVCVPHAGGRRHPAQRRVPEAAARHHPARLHAQPESAGLGGGGQRGNLHLHHQRLFGALGVMAASQCTMNNFTFGNAATSTTRPFRAAAGRAACSTMRGQLVGGFNGTSVVQTHMTNSRLTDPEVLEFRFPVRLDSYAIRQGLGRCGALDRGATAACAACAFLEPMTASILSNGRHHPRLAWPAAERRAGHQPRGARRRPRGAARPHRQRRDAAGRCVRDPHARWPVAEEIMIEIWRTDAHDAAHAGGRGRGGDRSDRAGLTTINGVAPDDPFALGSGQKDMKKPARGGFSGRPRADGA